MASIVKYKDGWRAHTFRDGRRKSKVFPTKREASSWAHEQEQSNASDILYSKLLERYELEITSKKPSWRWETNFLRRLGQFRLARIPLCDIRREDIAAYISEREKSVGAGTVLRELSTIGHTFTQARRWRLMDSDPMKDLERPSQPKHRERLITPDEIERLKVALSYEEDLPVDLKTQQVAVAMLFALETGMRAGEICNMQKEHIGEKSVYLPKTKNGHPRRVPLSPEARRLLKRLPSGCFELSSASLSTLFRRGMANAGITGLTFHDLRHSAITNLAQKLDVLDLARAVGHRDIKQLMTYYNKTADDLADLL